MPHIYPPEDPRSAASTFAPHQPGAGVVADDAEEKGQNPGGGTPASEASEQYADEPLPAAVTGPGPDRPGHKDLRDMSDEELQAAANVGGVPKGEGRKGEATRKLEREHAEAARKSAEEAKPLVNSGDDSKKSSSKK